MNPVRTFVEVWELSAARKRLLFEALLLLALSRFAVLVLPFRWVSKVLGRPGTQTRRVPRGPSHLRSIRDVRATLRKVPKHVPWTSKCLDQVIAAKIMLARRGIPATVYFGVNTKEDGAIDAHAWLRSGPVYVSGGATRNRFTVINTFGDADGG